MATSDDTTRKQHEIRVKDHIINNAKLVNDMASAASTTLGTISTSGSDIVGLDEDTREAIRDWLSRRSKAEPVLSARTG
jgi:hypothetical protein